jgi:tetratricopeptide (TPR) repeat protein
MSLSKGQKKYIQNHSHQTTSQIAKHLGVSETIIKEFLGPEKNTNKTVIKDSFHFISFIKTHYLYFLFFIFIIFVTYANSLQNDFVSDDVGIKLNVNNPDFIFAQPTTFIREFLNYVAYQLVGLQPFIFRAINIVFHIGVVSLIYIFLRLYTNNFIAFSVASIFAVHPVMVESITWVSGGIYTQYAFFVLLSLLFYSRIKQHKKYLVFSVLSYTLGLFSSEKAIVGIFIICLYEFTFGSLKKNWKHILPFVIVSGLYTLLYLNRLGNRLTTLHSTFSPSEKGYDNPLLQIPIAITSYIQLLLWPDNLTIYHSELAFSTIDFGIRAVLFIIFIACIIFAYKKDKTIFFWLTFFIISLLPMLTPLRITWIVAERYVYLGSLGIITTIVILISKIKLSLFNKKLLYVVFACIIVALSVRSVVRNGDWQNEDVLWIATGETSPSSPNNHNNLGDVYGRHGDKQRALQEFQKAIQLKPNYADAYHNLANTYQELGNPSEAITNYKKALEYNPNLWQSDYNLTAIYYSQGNFDEAKKYIEKAIALNPNDANMYVNYAAVLIKLNDKEKAKQQLSTALQLDPNNQNAKGLLEQIK